MPDEIPSPQASGPYAQGPSAQPVAGPYVPGTPPAGPYGYHGGQGYGQPPRRRRSGWFYAGVIGGGLLLLIAVFSLLTWAMVRAASSDEESTTALHTGGRIGVIDVDGVLMSADPISQQLHKFAADDDVKAIILHINSPGGGAAVSQELYHEVLRVRQEKHKKVIASIESVGASGAYYIASACDRIYANDASIVGSIGVIMEWTQYGDLLRWAKLKPVVLHAGELKDAGDPTHDLTPKEEAYFQGLIQNMYTQFIHDVATGRGLSDSAVSPLATGQVWTGQQALPLHLIDREGGFRVALMDTAREAGIKGEPGIVRPAKRKGLIGALTSNDADDLLPSRANLLNQSPGFYFMWK